MTLKIPLISGVVATLALALPANAGPAQNQTVKHFESQAKQGGGFAGFSAERGRSLFLSSPGSGDKDTPSCTTCHTESPFKAGQTRAGKPIDPMALSKTPDRYSDLEKVEKWFGRNCDSVLGRACTPTEKGDFLTFMIGQ